MAANFSSFAEDTLRTLGQSSPLSFLAPAYGALFEGRGEWDVFMAGGFFFTTAAFWGMSLFFLAVDLTGQPAFLLRYKMQPGQNEPLKVADLRRGLGKVLFNSVVLNVLLTALVFPLFRRISGPLNRPLPDLAEILLHLVVFVAVEEVGFYYSHRLFHQPFFYKRFHKIHHEWTAPIALTAVYAHPLEHVVANLIPVAAGPVLMGSHLVTLWLWFTLALMSTCYHHSGFHFPFTLASEFHDYHHLKFSNNFGLLGILDWIHGTDTHFRASPQFKNHRVFFSLTPISEITSTTKDIQSSKAKKGMAPPRHASDEPGKTE